MCNCQPDAAIWAEFQRSLFDRYPIDVEFVRRRRLARAALNSNWSTRLLFSVDHVAREFVELHARVMPLELQFDDARLVVETAGHMQETGEQCFFYRKFIPYFGDSELWELFVGAKHDKQIEGEIYNGELVLGVVEIAPEAAEEYFKDLIDSISEQIAVQRVAIKSFHSRLVPFVRHALERRWSEYGEREGRPVKAHIGSTQVH